MGRMDMPTPAEDFRNSMEKKWEATWRMPANSAGRGKGSGKKLEAVGNGRAPHRG